MEVLSRGDWQVRKDEHQTLMCHAPGTGCWNCARKVGMTNAHLCLTPYKQRHTKPNTVLIGFSSNTLNFFVI